MKTSLFDTQKKGDCVSTLKKSFSCSFFPLIPSSFVREYEEKPWRTYKVSRKRYQQWHNLNQKHNKIFSTSHLIWLVLFSIFSMLFLLLRRFTKRWRRMEKWLKREEEKKNCEMKMEVCEQKKKRWEKGERHLSRNFQQ